MRNAYNAIKSTNEKSSHHEVSLSKLREKLFLAPEVQRQILLGNLASLLQLIKHDEAEDVLDQTQFEIGMARLEKRNILTFISKLY